jgi:hypothetical protein
MFLESPFGGFSIFPPRQSNPISPDPFVFSIDSRASPARSPYGFLFMGDVFDKPMRKTYNFKTEAEVGIPAKTKITIDGKSMYITSDSISGDTNILRIIWNDSYQGKTDNMSVNWGHDYLDDPAISKLAIRISRNHEESPSGVTISTNDKNNIIAILSAAIPSDSGKQVILQGLGSDVTEVANYAKLVKDAILRIARSAGANVRAGA